MKDGEILKKAIEKAYKNGWQPGSFLLDIMEDMTKSFDVQTVARARIIFNHNFAKAFWGEEDMWPKTECSCGGIDFHIGGFDAHHPSCAKVKVERGYKFHLGKMVLEKNPLKYLEKFL